MNILETLEFDSHKPNVSIIRKNHKINQFAVALGRGAVLKKHTTSVPATLIVLEGEIRFLMEEREHTFKKLETFDIPVDVTHEVVGVANENIFLITQEL